MLVILRGFPGYQCPYCVNQVHDFVDHASDLKAKNAELGIGLPQQAGTAGVELPAFWTAALHSAGEGAWLLRQIASLDGVDATESQIASPSSLSL